MRGVHLWSAVLVGLMTLGGGALGQYAQACALDGIPSVSANGHLAAVNRVIPSANSTLQWAPFLFSQHFQTDQSIRFVEDTARIKSGTLLPDALHHAWRWQFGDGASAVATKVSHRYTHPGVYRVVVAARYPAGWMKFDEVIVTINR